MTAVKSGTEAARLGGASRGHPRDVRAVERASAPFVFRTGGLDGRGKKVWTLRAMVRHLDRHPEDGVFHLLNGTLAAWLEEQGAWDLAERARDAARYREHDPRIALEMFLVGSNLARRPPLAALPKRLVIGPVIAGELCEARLLIRKGRGRGYLFGTLRSSVPWLSVEPQFFAGGEQVAVVTVDSGLLPIGQGPRSGSIQSVWQAQLLIESSASAEPVAVPVTVRVVGIPSRLAQRVQRPLCSALLAAVLGAALGWGLGRSGLRAPGWLPGDVSPERAWAGGVSLLWALSGAVRGFCLPASRSWLYATARGLLRTAAMAAVIGLVLCGGLSCWAHFGPYGGAGLSAAAWARVLLGALAVAVVPATLVERRLAREAEQGTARPTRQPGKRRVRLSWVAVGLVLVVAILLGGPWGAAVRQHIDLDSGVSATKQWVSEHWTHLRDAARRLFERILFGPLVLRTPVPVASCALAERAASAPAPLSHVETRQCEQYRDQPGLGNPSGLAHLPFRSRT